MNHHESCPCCSDKPFEKCCARFLVAGSAAKTPEQLMRSRYTAYALGGLGEYLLDTWFPATSQGLSVLELSQKTLNWQRLEIHHKSQRGDAGAVEFSAWYKDAQGEEQCMHEKSEFRRIQGRWYYVGGEVG
jgi:SEC-C motif domain protein